jgi:SAM-dependent methyltransferase
VKSSAERRREVALSIAITEQVLGRPIRSVLDVGCGEGQWYPLVRRQRPAVRYTGVDASAYAVARFGARRHIRLGTIGALDALGLRAPFDLIVCSGILNYLSDTELERGLRQVVAVLDGVVYLELFTTADDVTGDTQFATWRTPAWNRAALARAGLVPCGMHHYVTTGRADASLAALETMAPHPPRPSRHSKRGASGRRASR